MSLNVLAYVYNAGTAAVEETEPLRAAEAIKLDAAVVAISETATEAA